MAPLAVGLLAPGILGGAGVGLAGVGGAFSAAQLGLSVASGLAFQGFAQQGAAAEAQAESQQNLAAFNAKVQEQEAKARRTAAKFAGKRQAEAGARTKGTLQARLAAKGGTGSPVALDLAAEQAAELELENLLIGFEGEVAATQAERRGALDLASGQIAKQKGKALKTASQVRAGTTLLTGFN